jgi:hypothetical protein
MNFPSTKKTASGERPEAVLFLKKTDSELVPIVAGKFISRHVDSLAGNEFPDYIPFSGNEFPDYEFLQGNEFPGY